MSIKKESTHISGLIKPLTTLPFTIDDVWQGERVDIFLSKQFDCYSRSFFQRLIDSGCVTINHVPTRKQGTALKINDIVTVAFPKHTPIDAHALTAKSLHVTCIHRDEHFLVICKPAGLSTHKPNEWYTEPTLVDWLHATVQDIAAVGYIDRPGIVHRLDKDTSGIMLIARTNHGHTILTDLFKQRAIVKSYLALVHGHPASQGTIDLPIKRHPTIRTKMRAVPHCERIYDLTSRDALTHYEVLHYFDTCSLVQVKPVTGRTHQIRVHFSAIGHPLLGDAVYGAGLQNNNKVSYIPRQALHAYTLGFSYQGTDHTFIHNPPDDFKAALVRAHNEQEPLPESIQVLLR